MADLLINAKITGGKKVESSLGSIHDAAKKAASSINSLQEELKKSKGVTSNTINEAVKLTNKLNELSLAEKSLKKGVNLLNKGLIDSTTFTSRYSKALSVLNADIKNSYGGNLKYEKSINDANKALKTQKDTLKNVESYFNKNAKVLKEAKDAQKKYNKSIVSDELKRGKKILQDIAKEEKRIAAEAKKAEAAQKKYNRSIVSNELKRGKKALQDIAKEQKRVAAEAKKAASAQRGFSSILKTMKAAAIGYVTVLATMKLTEFISDIIQVGVKFDSLKRSFEAITGSAEGAAFEMNFIRKTAGDLGLELVVLMDSYKDILAASKNTSLEGKGIRDVFLSITKAAAVLGMSADDTKGSLRALGQMISKGNVQAEELRGQLGERLPGAFQMAAEAMGVSTEELNDMLEAGDVLATDLLPKLADILEGRFSKAAVSAAKSARAEFNRLKNEIVELKVAIAEKGIIEDLGNLAKDAQVVLENHREFLAREVGFFSKMAGELGGAFLSFTDNIFRDLSSLGDVSGGLIFDVLGPLTQIEKFEKEIKKLESQIERLNIATDNTSNGILIQSYNEKIIELTESLKKAKSALELFSNAQTKVTEPELSESEQDKINKALQVEDAIWTAKEKMRKRNLDSIAKTQEKEIRETNSFYALLKSNLLRSVDKEEEIYKTLEKNKALNKQKINDKAAKARQDILDKETKQIAAKYKKEQKAFDTAKAKMLRSIKKAVKDREKVEEALSDKIAKLNKSEYNYKLYLLDKEVAAFRIKKGEEEDIQKYYVLKKLALLKEESAAAEKEREKRLKEEQKAYDEIYKKAENFSKEIIDNWDDMGNALVSMAEQMFKDIAAAFLTDAIVMPIYMSVLGSTDGKTTVNDSSGSTGLVSSASSLYSAISGETAETVSGVLQSGAVSSLGQSIFGEELWGTYGAIQAGTGDVASSGIVGALSENSFYGVIGSIGYSTIGDLVGLPQGEYSGIGAGVGATAGSIAAPAAAEAIGVWMGAEAGAEIGSYWPVVGTIIGAIVGGVGAALLGGSDDPDLKLGLFPGTFEDSSRSLISEDYIYSLFTQDTEASNYSVIIDYYDEVFKTLDEETNASINELIGNANTGDYGRIGWFDIEGMNYEEIIEKMNDSLFDALHEGLVKDIGAGVDPEVFDIDFFEAIQDAEDALLDTYLDFRDTVEAMGLDNFLEQFNYQMNTLGLSAEKAYENMHNISVVITEIESAAYSISNTETLTTLGEMVLSWEILIATLEYAAATTDQLAAAEEARNEIIGTNITGLTAEAVRSSVLSGGNISDIIDEQINNLASSIIAEDIYNNFISEMNEEVGAVFADSDYDLNAVIEYLNNIDTTDAQNEILEMQEAFGLIEGSAVAISEASRIVTLAIEGQLSASQQFAAWNIENAEALLLYIETIGAGVTQEELEGAIDAFVELGLEGSELETVIEDLADRFTDATDQMLQSISDIESAQDNLISTGDESDKYISDIANVLSFFQDIPTMGQIRGDEEITTIVFDEEAYKEAFANYVVESEFNKILGRDPSGDYWQEQLLDETSGIDFSNIGEAIIEGISIPEDTVDEIFNRLFGHSASGDYWVDQLLDATSGITLANIEESILAGASITDLEYYDENQGIVEISNWQDFGSFESLEEHLAQYSSLLEGFTSDDFTYEQISTASGEFASSEEEVLAAIELLEGLPSVISDGIINESGLAEFIDVISNMDAAVIEDIFGEGAVDQIGTLTDAVDEYYAYLEEASNDSIDSAKKKAEEAEAFENKKRGLEIELLKAQEEDELALAMEREDILSELTETYGDQAGVLIGLQESIWEANDAAERLATTIAIENKEEDLRISILKAQGLEEEALAIERENNIQSLREEYGAEAESLIILTQAFYDAEDAAERLAFTTAVENKEGDLRISILKAQGFEEEALTIERENNIASLREEYGNEADTMIELTRVLYGAEDAAERLATTIAIENKEEDLRISILKAQGLEEEALAIERENNIQSLREEYGAEAESLIILTQAFYDAEDAAEALTNAESDRESAANDYRTGLQEELDILENNLEDAKSTYLNLLNDELSIQEELVSSLKSSIESIQDFKDELRFNYDIQSSTETQSELLAKRTILFAQAYSGETDSVSDLISTSEEYLNVTKGLSKNSIEYAIEVAKTNVLMTDVEKSLGVQLTEAEQQVELLSSLVDGITGAAEEITDINEARTAYESAKKELDDNWYSAEIAKLDEILDSSKSLEELMSDFNAAQISYDSIVLGSGSTPIVDIPIVDIPIVDIPIVDIPIVDPSINEILNQATLNPDGTYNLANTYGATWEELSAMVTANVDIYKDKLGFATGGSFEVSGPAGIDALSLPGLRVTAGEVVNISRPDTMSVVSSELGALLAELQNLRSDQRAQILAIVKLLQNIDDNTDYLELWDEVGIPKEQA